MYKIVFFVPEEALETVKKALFAKGAGRSKKYSHACWQVLGHMQYKPLAQSKPAIGNEGEFIITNEYRVEMTCEVHLLEEIIAQLHSVHPYEEPAYEIYPISVSIKDIKQN
ncbi:MAG: hypothetical protein K0S27_1600 [Gammaproteobacteria bacterium]|jgi:hypothetical protein|nr:hypothetical protein [Gammaproteobacteria bacterium]